MHLKPILIVLLPVLLFAAVGLVGSTRQLGFWWTLLISLLLTPIGGFVFAVLSGPRRPREPAPTAEPAPISHDLARSEAAGSS